MKTLKNGNGGLDGDGGRGDTRGGVTAVERREDGNGL